MDSTGSLYTALIYPYSRRIVSFRNIWESWKETLFRKNVDVGFLMTQKTQKMMHAHASGEEKPPDLPLTLCMTKAIVLLQCSVGPGKFA
ncbi:hypothetical protein DdX_08804 [Ditylenchus destructor]|uniref:Uncharacterized protein n=1 Tax=Ditylenchus destructor TaxID=166010 RepID=A0AAD4N7D7_9BILA|nr:hypothetical protein DdX_08804 [Ditylenchus destructor]